MVTMNNMREKVCETCKKPCGDDYVYMSAPVNSRVVCLCSKDAKDLAETCKQYGILFALY